MALLKVFTSLLGGKGCCPASEQEKKVVEDGFLLLRKRIGIERLTAATVPEPSPAFFPDPYDGTPRAAAAMFSRVCGYLGVDANTVQLGFFEDGDEQAEPAAVGGAYISTRTRGAAGYYLSAGGRHHVLLNAAGLGRPEALAATMAHELAHVLLLGGGFIKVNEPHMEAITDLATIYLGMGVFTANTLLVREGWSAQGHEGWSMQRKGYISPEMAGWALALFAWTRGERQNPVWARSLAADGKGYLKQGLKFLREGGGTTFP